MHPCLPSRSREFDSPHRFVDKDKDQDPIEILKDATSTAVKLDKGPAEVLAALIADDPEALKEAMEFQRESFRAKFRCYPEEMEVHEFVMRRGLYTVEGICSCGKWRSGYFWDRTPETEALAYEAWVVDHGGG